MFSLSTKTFIWNKLLATSEMNGPMKKAYCALLPLDNQLLAFGGSGGADPSNPSPLAQYEKDESWVYTNEHHVFDKERGEHYF